MFHLTRTTRGFSPIIMYILWELFQKVSQGKSPTAVLSFTMAWHLLSCVNVFGRFVFNDCALT